MGSLLRRLVAVVALAAGIGLAGAATANAATPHKATSVAPAASHTTMHANDWWF